MLNVKLNPISDAAWSFPRLLNWAGSKVECKFGAAEDKGQKLHQK